MTANTSSASVFNTLSEYSNISTFVMPSAEVLLAGGTVLSCQRYCEEGYQAKHSLELSGFDCKQVVENYTVAMPLRFARTRVQDPEFGVPFLTGSAIAEAKVDKSDLISTTRTPSLESILLKENSVVVTRSGTIGNVRFITEDIAGCAGTDDLIRVEARSSDFSIEYFYAFSLSTLGKALITKDTYGGVIDHIEPDHLDRVSLPVLPQKLRDEITRLVKEASTLRVRANALLAEAEGELKETCRLPELSQLKADNLIPTESEATVFSWSFNKRLKMNGQFGTLRIDAAYHSPTASALAKHILDNGGTTLGDVLTNIRRSSLRQRYYVDEPSQGVPIIGGKQLMQLRPSEVKYLSRVLTRNIKSEQISKGWILVACGGTIGRTLLVHRNYEEWCASEHVMRLVPNTGKVFPGYLYAFISSPYGQLQIQPMIHGSVIQQIRDFEFEPIAICIPPDKGESIHNKVVEAFDARADARIAEDKAIELFMTAIREGKEKTESSWGRDY